MPPFRKSLRDSSMHAMEWRHLWSLVAPIGRNAPVWMQSDVVFINFSDRIDRAIVDGSIRDMDESCTGLYLYCIEQVRSRGLKQWW